MDGHSEDLTLDELAERAGTSPRTIRFYIAEGLLPGPGSRGKGALYGEEHLTRLRLVRLLAEQRVPLAKIRATLEGLSSGELREMLAHEDARQRDLRAAERSESPKAFLAKLLEGAREAREARAPREAAAPSATGPSSVPFPPAAPAQAKRANERSSYRRGPAETWQRWKLAPGVELHVRRDASLTHREMIERLLSAVGDEMERADT